MPTYKVRFEMVDDYNRPSSKSFETVPTTVDYAAAAAAAAALAVDLAVLTELRVLAYTITERIVMVDAVTAGANRDEGVVLSLRKPDQYLDDIRIPGPINAIFDDNGNVITPLPAAVDDFLDNFADGTGDFTFSDGEQFAEFVRGYLEG